MRRVVIIIGGLLAAALIALAVLPWWLGPVLKSVARRYGADFARYERVGYARFALRDVTVRSANTTVTADRVEAETPLLWLVHRWSGRPAAIVAGTWNVEIKKPSDPRPASPSAGAMQTRAQLFKIADALERWLPLADVGRGLVKWPGAELRFDSASWRKRVLAAKALRYGEQAADVAATFAKTGELQLALNPGADSPWQLTLTSVRDEITGQLKVWDQTAPIQLRLPERGWLPTDASVLAERWTIPATRLKLGDSYSTVRGDVRLEWRQGRFEATADIAGEVAPDKKAPPLAVKLHARGDNQALTVDALAVDIPGVNAKLSAPVVVDRQGRMPAGASQIALEIDLEKLSWLPGAKGKISGRAQALSKGDAVPHFDGTFEARDVSFRDWGVARFTAAAALDWPRLQVSEAVLGFSEGGQLRLRGGWNFQAKEVIDAVAEGVVRPSVVARWLPEKMKFESATVAAKAQGPLDALHHEGSVRVAAVIMAPLNPLAVDLAWRGTGAALEISEASAQAGASRVVLAGSLDANGARLAALKLEQSGTVRLTLAQPVAVLFSPKWEIGPLRLTQGEASISAAVSAGEAGRLELAARNFPSAWLADFVTVAGPDWRIASFDAKGEWDRGPATFTVRGDSEVTLAPGRLANVALAAQGDRSGIVIESLRVSEGAAPIVTASGQLPLMLHPGAAPLVRIEKEGALTLKATTASNPAFWKKLSEATGLEFQEPELDVGLSGTWTRPQGEFTVKAARVAADPQRIKFLFPTVEGLDAHARADGGGLVLDRLSIRVEGQAVRANGKLPFAPGQWADLKREPVAFVRRHGSLRIEMPDAELAAVSRYTGDYLAPLGRLHVDVALKPGGEMEGTLRLEHAATRPLGPLGVLQEVEVETQFAGRTLAIKKVTARAGGQPVTLTGKVELPLEGAPRYDLALAGENLPLVRQTGLLMRADLDLKLVTQTDNATAVTGAVRLRDSMFLSDVRALIPRGGGGGPARRPPFFAITTPPLDAWRLDIAVSGDRFLRLRSTVFNGVVSARFRLGGTLGDPRATGEAVIDSGQVLLPFATFRVEQGAVRLTEADPYSLQLFLAATSRRYGYDLRMELTGTAADPLVTFSSSPPLDAEQVLLMVTAGELPRNEVTYGGAQRVARLGTYLGQSLINNFGGDAADADRLSISTGERVSRQGRETYDIQYRMTDRFTLVGEYDEFDAYNAGVKWRMFAPKTDIEQRATKTGASDATPR